MKYKFLEMVEEMGLCIDELTDIFQECISLSTMVSDNELGISGWKSGFLYKDFTKKKVQEVLDCGKYLHMQLFMKLPYLQHVLEHLCAPSKEFAKRLQVYYLIIWIGCPIALNEHCYKWP